MYEEYWYLAYGFITLISGLAVSFIVMPFVMKWMKNKRIVGIDAHKKDEPVIPEMGGVSLLIGLTVSMLIASAILPEMMRQFLSFLTVTLIAGAVGALDDLKTLSAKMKPFLTIFAGLPILVMNTYDPYLPLPLIGSVRFTIIYPIMIPIAIAVTSNAVNMMDPFNGVMSGTCSIITIVLLISAIFLGRSDATIICAGLLGSLLALWYFNKYPSRAFVGDVGSLSVGAALGAIAIIGRLEVIAVVAFMPQIMNAFYGLSSIGRLFERHEVQRPTHILENGKLASSTNSNAPLTLARMILARGPLTEPEAIRVFIVLSLISGLLALITMYSVLIAPS